MGTAHTRSTDEQLLIQFAENNGQDAPELVGAIGRLKNCIAKGLQDYAMPNGESAKRV